MRFPHTWGGLSARGHAFSGSSRPEGRQPAGLPVPQRSAFHVDDLPASSRLDALKARPRPEKAAPRTKGTTQSLPHSLVLILLLALPLSAADTVIQNATVLTITKGTFHGSVVIRDGKIVDAGEKVMVPQGARVIDAAGQYIMPG